MAKQKHTVKRKKTALNAKLKVQRVREWAGQGITFPQKQKKSRP